MNRRSIVAARVSRKAVWGGEVGRTARLMLALALTLLSASCGDLTRQGTGSSYLIINTLQAARGDDPGAFGTNLNSDVVTDSGGQFNDLGQVTLQLAMKDVTTGTEPTTANFITITRYHVRYIRADGRNTPGVDVPYAFDGAATATVSSTSTIGFEMVRIVAKREAPLAALGRNRAVFISAIAEVTFFGHDQTGREASVTGQIFVTFGDFIDVAAS
jgi:hypothetical protein